MRYQRTSVHIAVFLGWLMVLGSGFSSLHALQPGFHNTIQDFRCGIIDFREDGLTGIIKDGALVYPSPADLQPGDIFIDVDGTAKKVARVEQVGNELYVDTVAPRFEEVYLYAAIPDQTLELASSKEASSRNAKGSFDISFEKEIWNKAPALVKISAAAELNSNLSVGFKAPSCVQIEIRGWKFWEWTIGFRYESGYIQAAMDYDLDLSGGLTFALEKSMESDPVLLYGFGTPTAGVSANLGLMTKTSLEGSLELSLPLTFGISGNAGVRCTLNGQVPYMVPTDVSQWGSTEFSVSIEPSLTAAATLKQKIYLGADITLVGIKITEFEAGGGPYFKLEGTLDGSIGYNSSTGLEGPDWSASGTGEIGVFTEVGGKVCDGKWEVTIFDREYPIFTLFDLSTPEEKLSEHVTIPRRVSKGGRQ